MILEKIIEKKKTCLNERKKKIPLEQLKRIVPHSHGKSLTKAFTQKPFVIIAETKKASPSAGIIKKTYHPEKIALSYQKAGADAVSVLTEEKFFLGKLDDLKKVKTSVKIPVLMKDFIIDPYQLYEAKLYKADVILLIVRILQVPLFKTLLKLARNLGLEIIIEVHDKKEIKTVLKEVNDFSGIIIGINNRNLDTLKTDVQTTFDLLSCLNRVKIPVISESGIKDGKIIKKLFDAGVNGILIGEHLLKAKTPLKGINKLTKGIVYGH